MAPPRPCSTMAWAAGLEQANTDTRLMSTARFHDSHDWSMIDPASW